MKNEGSSVFVLCFFLGGEGGNVPIGELSSCKHGHHTAGPSKLAVPMLSF